MKVGIICSLAFAKEAGKAKEQLEQAGHSVSLPFTVQDILDGAVTVLDIEDMKQDASFSERTRDNDLIRRNWDRMKGDDAILVVNCEKNGIKGYIGANTFLEIGFAYVQGKLVYLWNDMPDMEFHQDELLAMAPIIIKGDIARIVG